MKKIQLKDIDVTYDFSNEPELDVWKDFWKRRDGLGEVYRDIDIFSKKLRQYHQCLWSKKLPNGDIMDLSMGAGRDYLIWNNFCFASDNITASFRYKKNKHLIVELEKTLPNYKLFMEDFLHKTYTIGGTIIFPKRRWSINQARGCNPKIKDRWDLTLECIRKYYLGEDSPLYKTLSKDKAFFDLFVDFKGYVDFFYLQDCVSADYKNINFGMEYTDFIKSPLPKSKEEYLKWLDYNLEFAQKRNLRIQKAIKQREKDTINFIELN